MSNILDSIGLRNGTDKSSTLHDYLRFYEEMFASIRLLPITILEIGVFLGASLQTWKDYFPNAKIIGVDIQPTAKQFESPRVAIELADQSNLEHLAQICLKHGPFDIVIDDGSHMWEHQITSLRTLFPFVKDGGFYVVEDLQTNYGELQDKYQGRASQSCMDYLKSWLDAYVGDQALDLESLEDPFLRTYGRAVHFIRFNRRACAIRKRYPRTDWRVSQGPALAPAPANALRTVINAHVGLRGDIFGASGFVDEGADDFTIQGFALESEARALEYRVLYPDGHWSEWFPENGFAGTRGKALPILGFTVRPRAGSDRPLAVRVWGRFVGGQFVSARDGEDCVTNPPAALRGLQVSITPGESGLQSSDVTPAGLAEPVPPPEPIAEKATAGLETAAPMMEQVGPV